MICPECKSKLLVINSREKGCSQVRFRICQNEECNKSASKNWIMVTKEKLDFYRKKQLKPPYLRGNQKHGNQKSF